MFSPVSFTESPATVSPQKNLTGLPRVVKDIAADVYNNIQKWNDNQIQGAKIVKEITQIKSDSSDTYPSNLETFMTELEIIVQNLSVYAKALEFLASQIKSLVKLHKQPTPLFSSLDVEKISEIVEEISKAYKAEFMMKQYVLESIAHCCNKNDVMFYAAAWTHQLNISKNINFKLEVLLTETGHRKINRKAK